MYQYEDLVAVVGLKVPFDAGVKPSAGNTVFYTTSLFFFFSFLLGLYPQIWRHSRGYWTRLFLVLLI